MGRHIDLFVTLDFDTPFFSIATQAGSTDPHFPIFSLYAILAVDQ